MNTKLKATAFIWNIDIFNIINYFTVAFDQFNASLLKYILFHYQKWIPQTFEE